MDILLQDCTGRACYKTVPRLFFTTRLYGETYTHTRTLPKTLGRFFLLLQEYTRAVHYQTARRRRAGTSVYFFRLLDCTAATTPMMSAFFPAENRSFKYYYYTLITLLHSLRLRPLLLQTPRVTRSSFQDREGNFHLWEGNFRYLFPSISWQPYILSNLPPEGRQSRNRGSGGGTFSLEEIFTSPGPNPTPLLLIYIHKRACVWIYKWAR